MWGCVSLTKGCHSGKYPVETLELKVIKLRLRVHRRGSAAAPMSDRQTSPENVSSKGGEKRRKKDELSSKDPGDSTEHTKYS